MSAVTRGTAFTVPRPDVPLAGGMIHFHTHPPPPPALPGSGGAVSRIGWRSFSDIDLLNVADTNLLALVQVASGEVHLALPTGDWRADARGC